eukprot:TRINITY_DN1793_c0_g2_i1.p2 TRINITY_DN1793_c0_g2~~TRINITY_DN1793_c0_g2_i1.p2  ORF type:complete len:123 (-),score=5.56 TRINITY_DN1793_c0_g2_i1:1-369(-)
MLDRGCHPQSGAGPADPSKTSHDSEHVAASSPEDGFNGPETVADALLAVLPPRAWPRNCATAHLCQFISPLLSPRLAAQSASPKESRPIPHLSVFAVNSGKGHMKVCRLFPVLCVDLSLIHI